MPDYAAMIRELKDEKARVVQRIDTAIAVLEELAAGRHGREQLSLPVAPEAGRSIMWPYKGMSVAKAAQELLRATGRAMTATEVARALKEGGIETKAENFTPIVYNALNGNKRIFASEKRGQSTYWHVATPQEAKVA